jgi:hypothetical protein
VATEPCSVASEPTARPIEAAYADGPLVSRIGCADADREVVRERRRSRSADTDRDDREVRMADRGVRRCV